MASEAQIKATRKYEAAHYDFIKVRVPKGTKEQIQATGDSINGFILSAILEKLEKYKDQA